MYLIKLPQKCKLLLGLALHLGTILTEWLKLVYKFVHHVPQPLIWKLHIHNSMQYNLHPQQEIHIQTISIVISTTIVQSWKRNFHALWSNHIKFSLALFPTLASLKIIYTYINCCKRKPGTSKDQTMHLFYWLRDTTSHRQIILPECMHHLYMKRPIISQLRTLTTSSSTQNKMNPSINLQSFNKQKYKTYPHPDKKKKKYLCNLIIITLLQQQQKTLRTQAIIEFLTNPPLNYYEHCHSLSQTYY